MFCIMLILDKATQKKLATDAMYKLEHGSDDKQRGKLVIPTIGQITDERYQYKDDYIINKIARDKFRVMYYTLLQSCFIYFFPH